jgi:hypothetical protein
MYSCYPTRLTATCRNRRQGVRQQHAGLYRVDGDVIRQFLGALGCGLAAGAACGESGAQRAGGVAVTLMRQLNKANGTIKSLDKRALEWFATQPEAVDLQGTITGTPD